MSKPFIVIGIDPGKMTGLFAYYYAPRLGTSEPIKPWTWFEQFTAEIAPFKLRDYLNECADIVGATNVHIAVEKFIINARTARLSQQSEALEVTGLVKGFAAVRGSYVSQYLKANLKFASDDALRRAGWYTTCHRHANDAARQAFALLKDVDYPLWCRVSDGAMLESDDR